MSQEAVIIEDHPYYAVLREGVLHSVHATSVAAWEAVSHEVDALVNSYPAIPREHWLEDFSVTPTEVGLEPDHGKPRVGWALS